jgi:hypothetical protein
MWCNPFDSDSVHLVPNPKSYQIKGMLEVAVFMPFQNFAGTAPHLWGHYVARVPVPPRAQRPRLEDWFCTRTARWWAIRTPIFVGTPAACGRVGRDLDFVRQERGLL